jgi:hypothetical protein
VWITGSQANYWGDRIDEAVKGLIDAVSGGWRVVSGAVIAPGEAVTIVVKH